MARASRNSVQDCFPLYRFEYFDSTCTSLQSPQLAAHMLHSIMSRRFMQFSSCGCSTMAYVPRQAGVAHRSILRPD